MLEALRTLAFKLWAWCTALGIRKSELPSNATAALAKVMVDYNRPVITYYPNRTVRNHQVNAEIHKISPALAYGLATTLEQEATRCKINVAYAAACLYQESSFDPEAVNRNLREHEGIASFDGTDWGIGQQSGRQARILFPGLSEQAIKRYLLDPTWAIKQFADTMATNLAWANARLTEDATLMGKIADLDGTARAPWTTKTRRQATWWLATVAYNRGRVGCLRMLDKQTPSVPHGLHVQVWLTKFAPLLDPTLVSELQ